MTCCSTAVVIGFWVQINEAFPHMARKIDLLLIMLQGIGPSQVGLYPPSVLERWPPLHTLDEAALRHSRVG